MAANARPAQGFLHPLGIGYGAGQDDIVLHKHSSFLSYSMGMGEKGVKAEARENAPPEGRAQRLIWNLCAYAERRSTSATAWAAMPEPSPVKPRPSSVVALTLTRSASIPRAAAMFSAIWAL